MSHMKKLILTITQLAATLFVGIFCFTVFA